MRALGLVLWDDAGYVRADVVHLPFVRVAGSHPCDCDISWSQVAIAAPTKLCILRERRDPEKNPNRKYFKR